MEKRQYVPMDKKEKAKIVQNVEKRLASWIIDPFVKVSVVDVPKKTQVTNVIIMEEQEDNSAPTSVLYDELFSQAVDRIRHLSTI